MVTKEYQVIDVFTDSPLSGNPAAVFLDCGDLETPEMQAIAREMNLSETVFVTGGASGGADMSVRIFTPRSELPFAGHPLIAAGHLCRTRIDRPDIDRLKMTINCAAGDIDVTAVRSADKYIYTVRQLPPQHWSTDLTCGQAAGLLSLSPWAIGLHPVEIVSTGVRWLLIPVKTFGEISAISPDQTGIKSLSSELEVDGVIAFAFDAASSRVRLRTFAPRQGIDEDPVCGSGNGAVGAYLHRYRLLSDDRSISYVAEQGAEVGRPGQVYVDVQERKERIDVLVGGAVYRSAVGKLTFTAGPNLKA